MGESLVEAPKVEIKMEESVAPVPCLQESVSFGRFEHDSLCWERWSTFPANKYLEEVEKCSTPGSVAQKKAYFEAHYKKIAARKIELMDQEKRDAESMNSEDQSRNMMGSVSNSSEEELEVGSSDTRNSANGTEPGNHTLDFAEQMSNLPIDVPGDGVGTIDEENKDADFTGDVSGAHNDITNDGANVIVEENQASNFTIEVIEHMDESNAGADTVKENNDLQPQTEDLCSKSENSNLEPQYPEWVKEEAPATLVSQDREEEKGITQDKVEEREMVKKETEDIVKFKTTKKLQKKTTIMQPTLVKKTANSASAVRKPASSMLKGSAASTSKGSATPMPRRSIVSTPKAPMSSTPKSFPQTVMSISRSSVKKENGFTSLSSDRAIRPDSKKILSTSSSSDRAIRPDSKNILSTSLNISLSGLEPVNSDSLLVTKGKKSLIMERMGDKDIVKRAFKAFQTSNQPSKSGLVSSLAVKQSVTRKSEQKSSCPGTLQKKKEENLRPVKPTASLALRQEVKKALSPGSRKNTGVDQRNGKPTVSSFGSRSLDLGNKQKEVSKKMQKTVTKEVGKTYLQSKVTLEKGADIRRPSQSSKSKAMLSMSCNQGRVPKVLLKEDSNSKASA